MTFFKSQQRHLTDEESLSTASRRSSVTLVESAPPPYSNPRATSASEKPAIPRCIQLCHHETLSFERMQLILGLPKFKEDHAGIGALQGTFKEHRRFEPDSLWRCRVDTHFCSAYPEMTCHLKYLSNPKYEDGFPQLKGLRLIIDLSVQYYGAEKEGQTRQKILEFLGEMRNVSLCPHKLLGDPWIVDSIYKVSNPRGQSTDPVDEWLTRDRAAEAIKQKPFKLVCDYCATMIKVDGCENNPTVSATRCLGKGESGDDRLWLAQSIPQEM